MNITPDTSADPQLSREDALAILNTPERSLFPLLRHSGENTKEIM